MSIIHFFQNPEAICFAMINWPVYNTPIDDDSVDIVYLWVNGSDPLWQKYFLYSAKKYNLKMKKKQFDARFIEGDELKYSLRSIEMFVLHFIRYVFLIVPNFNTQIPCWLNTSHPQIKILFLRDIFPLPIPEEYRNDPNSVFIFNSNSIDNIIPSIPNLADKFIYMNDDYFFGNRVEKSDFFDEDGRPKMIVNTHNFRNAYREYQKLEILSRNDFAGNNFNAVITGTVSLIQKKLNFSANLDLYHVAHPYRKDLWKEALMIFGKEINETIASPFRAAKDIQAGMLSLQFGLYRNQIIPIQFQKTFAHFVILWSQRDLKELKEIAEQRPKMFCINCDNANLVSQNQMFLSSYFPNKSSFEL